MFKYVGSATEVPTVWIKNSNKLDKTDIEAVKYYGPLLRPEGPRSNFHVLILMWMNPCRLLSFEGEDNILFQPC